MTVSLRPALLMGAILIASGFAPAQAGSNSAATPLMASASLPRVATPDLLSGDTDPVLAGDVQQDLSIDDVAAPSAPAEPVEPEVSKSESLGAKVARLGSSTLKGGDLECLAIGIYFESKGEPLAGQLAVGQVIANRASSGRFPSGYCGVLKQRGQFSFVRAGKFPSVKRASKAWKEAVGIAKVVDAKLHESSVGKALFFHARYVSPKWRLTRVASIGNHVFYR